jgi:hypothetical protein
VNYKGGQGGADGLNFESVKAAGRDKVGECGSRAAEGGRKSKRWSGRWLHKVKKENLSKVK